MCQPKQLHPRQDSLVQPRGASCQHSVQDHALDERGRVCSHVHQQQHVQQGAPLVFVRRLGIKVPHRPVVALSRSLLATTPLPACRPIPARLEDMPNRPLPEMLSAHDGSVRRPCCDLQARAAHHSPPRSHAVCAKHHHQ